MTTCAMMAGMLPMALALGEAGQQNAPLGRAVIGGLAAATAATLFVLPAVFALVQSRATIRLGVSRSRRPGQRLPCASGHSRRRVTMNRIWTLYRMASPLRLAARGAGGAGVSYRTVGRSAARVAGRLPCRKPHSGSIQRGARSTAATAACGRRSAWRACSRARSRPSSMTPLWAKLPAYVEKLYVDIGDRVEAEQLLVDLSLPEMKDELRQKEAAVVAEPRPRSNWPPPRSMPPRQP